MSFRKKSAIVAMSLFVMAAGAMGSLFRGGVVQTVREDGLVSVRLEGDAAADLFEYVSETVPVQYMTTTTGQSAAVVWGDTVTCVHVQGRGFAGRWMPLRDRWYCQVDVHQGGAMRASSASAVLKIIGVEN